MAQPAPAVRTDVVHPSWVPVLDHVAPALRGVGTHLAAEAAAGHAVLPAPERVLRALATPLDDVRVVIVGQDPYPTPGHPVGLAFAVDRTVTVLPGSLRNIYRELHADTGLPVPGHGDLSAWAERGVLLLNRVLTVRAGAPGSHRQRGWEQVTDAVLRALVHRDGPLVAVLWGRQAQALRPVLGDVPVVAGAHPSPLSASRGFLGSRPFSRVDELLTAQGADPADWSLPR